MNRISLKKIGRAILALGIVLLVLVGATLGFLTIRHRQAIAQAEQEWQAIQVTPILDLGTTQSLVIAPLVDAEASEPAFQAEHGVSYLVKTDTATILFDAGMNANRTDPSPLLANMQRLDISLDDVQIIVISHNHPDHVGGVSWWRAQTFSLGNQQLDLTGKSVYVPESIIYPGLTPIIANQPLRIAPGVATLGAIPFAEVWQVALFRARNAEQALAVHVEGNGIVIITGCGHQTLPKLIARTQMLFDEPIIGIVGGLHYENADAQAMQPDIQRMQNLPLQLIALSPHDSGEAARQALQKAFPAIYQDVLVGQPIQIDATVDVTVAADLTLK